MVLVVTSDEEGSTGIQWAMRVGVLLKGYAIVHKTTPPAKNDHGQAPNFRSVTVGNTDCPRAVCV